MFISLGHETTLDLLSTCSAPGSLVVDVGAFPGTLARLMKHYGWSVIALDKDPERGVTSQQRFQSGDWQEENSQSEEATFSQSMRSIDVEVRCVDIETQLLPLESGTVDAIVLTEVIEHLMVDPLFALTEMNRILKCNTGVLLLSTPNLLSIRNRLNFLWGRIDRVIEHPFVAFLKKTRLGHVGHIRLYAPAELETMLRLLGFEPHFHFYSFDYWDAAVTKLLDNQIAVDKDLKVAAPFTPHSRSLVRKLFRSPKSYLDACVATIRQCLERIVPPMRPHIFVVAKKVRDADYRAVSMAEITSAIRSR